MTILKPVLGDPGIEGILYLLHLLHSKVVATPTILFHLILHTHIFTQASAFCGRNQTDLDYKSTMFYLYGSLFSMLVLSV